MKFCIQQLRTYADINIKCHFWKMTIDLSSNMVHFGQYFDFFLLDLRMKMEPVVQQEEPPNSTSGGGSGDVPGLSNNGSANGSLGQLNKYQHDRDKADLIPASLWNSVSGKLSHKTGTVNTPDGE